MNSKQSGRRRFLKDSAVLAGVAVGTMRSASGQEPDWKVGYQPDVPNDLRKYGQPSRYGTLTRTYKPAGRRATDDLVGWTERKDGESKREPGFLDGEDITREDAEAMIMQARVKAGWITEADLAQPPAEAAPAEAEATPA